MCDMIDSINSIKIPETKIFMLYLLVHSVSLCSLSKCCIIKRGSWLFDLYFCLLLLHV